MPSERTGFQTAYGTPARGATSGAARAAPSEA